MRARILISLAVLVALAASAATPNPARFTAVMHKATFEQSGTHPIRFESRGKHPALHTGARDEVGRALEQKSIHLSERPRLHPQLIVTASDGMINKVVLDYGDEAFAIPASTLLVKARHTDALMASIAIAPLTGGNEKVVELNWPEGVKSVAALHSEMLLEFNVEHQETTTFAYTLEDGIPSDVYDSEQMYDLAPHNSTMLTKFMIKFSKPEGHPKMSVWVSRKPIAPDFTLIVAVDGEIFAQANIEHDPKSTDALGFDVDVSKDVGRLLKGRIDFVCHYYETPRHHVATLRLPNLREKLSELKSADKPMNKLNLETSIPNLLVQLQYHQRTNFVGLRVLQSAPMKDLQLSMYRIDVDDSANEVGRTLFLREADDVVPYYAPEKELQYGWDDALPAEVDAMTVEGEDLFNGPAEIEIWYNSNEEPGIASDFARWLVNGGGKVGALEFKYIEQEDHSYEGRHALKSKAGIETGDIIASVPYSLIVTSSAIERGAWSKMLSNSSEKHKKHVAENAVHPDADKIMHLATVVQLQLFDESANYRPYFNTFTTSANKLAAYFTDDELALFDFDPQVSKELRRMRELWAVEYSVLEDAIDLLPRSFTKSTYFYVRSQVETRLLNLTGELALVPIVDLLTHDDHPNCKIEYNDEAHMVSVIAAQPITAGTPLTIDFGYKDKTALDFLVQFGFIPPKSIDAVVIDLPVLGASYLTAEPDARQSLAQQLAAARGNADSDDDVADALGDVDVAIRARFAALSKFERPNHPKSKKLAKAADALLQTEREVLHRHISAMEN